MIIVTESVMFFMRSNLYAKMAKRLQAGDLCWKLGESNYNSLSIS
jgi:hypothetical protein